MSESPKDLFPKKCPSCGGPRRFISFIKLTHSELMPFAWIPVVDKRFKKAGPLFADCQACHESWVWVPDVHKWVDAREIQKESKRKAVTEKPEKVKEDKDEIGKIY